MEERVIKRDWVSLACVPEPPSALPNLSTYLSALWPWRSHVVGPWARALALPTSCRFISLPLSLSPVLPPSPNCLALCPEGVGVLPWWLRASPALGFSEFTAQHAVSPAEPPGTLVELAGAGAAPANQWFEEALCNMSLFPSSFLLGVQAISLPVMLHCGAAVGQGGSRVERADLCGRLPPSCSSVWSPRALVFLRALTPSERTGELHAVCQVPGLQPADSRSPARSLDPDAPDLHLLA